ncbi:hypothetical protein AVEN_95549-1 [Araneus ventricosus]|uniref:Uncharacterized protein n=1 Tax=Araneus ventricosus TaxID=182803 RepID=A0A4Y2HBA3_ARAVE|nr:hypothetical protein AVEN_95549-1 [Araneus ventricosus]
MYISLCDRISADTFRNCFDHEGFCEKLEEKLPIVIETPEGIPKEEYELWMSIDKNILYQATTLTNLEIFQTICEQDKSINVDDSDGQEWGKKICNERRNEANT